VANLAPGEYNISSVKDGYTPTYQIVTVVKGSITEVDLKTTKDMPIIPVTGNIIGIVTDNNDKALAGVNLKLTGIDGTVKEATSDENGGFSFRDLTAGQYNLVTTLEGYVFNQKQVDVTAGQDTNISVKANSPETSNPAEGAKDNSKTWAWVIVIAVILVIVAIFIIATGKKS